MKFSCSKDLLAKAVSTVSRLATTRATLPILQNIYIEAQKHSLKVRSTDLEQTLEVTVPATVEELGKITTPARLIQEYLQNVTDEQITAELQDTTLILKSANHTGKIRSVAAEEYPTLPDVISVAEITLPAAALQDAIAQTIFTSANDDTRPILTGLLFRFQEGKLIVVGTDGYRLATTILPVSAAIQGDYILPRRTLQELLRLLSGSSEVELAFSQTQIRLAIGDTVLISRILDGAFPPYENIIPKTSKETLRVNGAALLQSLKLASLFSRDSAFSTKLDVDGTKLRITAISPQLGENTNEITLDAAAKSAFTVSLNAQYVADFLVAVGSPELELLFVDKDSPVVFHLTTKPADQYLYLVMPLRSE